MGLYSSLTITIIIVILHVTCGKNMQKSHGSSGYQRKAFSESHGEARAIPRRRGRHRLEKQLDSTTTYKYQGLMKPVDLVIPDSQDIAHGRNSP